MIEVVVAVVILAVTAAVIVPRLMASNDRKARGEADGAAALVTQAARRQMLTSSRVAIEYNADQGGLSVVTLKPADTADFDARERLWVQDPLMPRAPLDTLEVISATSSASAAPLDSRKFHVDLTDQNGRVALAIVLRDRVSGGEWTIRLPITADRAVVITGSDTRDLKSDQDTIDLDDVGKRDSPW